MSVAPHGGVLAREIETGSQSARRSVRIQSAGALHTLHGLVTRVREYPYVRALRRRVVRAHHVVGARDATDWVKVSALRQWVYETAPTGSASLLLDHDRLTMAGIFRPILGDRGVVWCGGAARGLQLLAQAFGFTAYSMDLGAEELDSHTVTLIRISHRGQWRLVVQDPYFNQTWVDHDGEPLDIFVLLDVLGRRQHEALNVLTGDGEKPLLLDSSDVWAEISERSPEIELPDARRKYRFPATFEFFRKHGGTRAVEQLSAMGFPPDPSYLLLFPRGMWGAADYSDLYLRLQTLATLSKVNTVATPEPVL